MRQPTTHEKVFGIAAAISVVLSIPISTVLPWYLAWPICFGVGALVGHLAAKTIIRDERRRRNDEWN